MSLLLDSAAETVETSAGIPAEGRAEPWILEHPDQFISLQKRYADAGCDILCAPTQGASRVRLAALGLADRVEERNLRLAALSREAAARAHAPASGIRIAGCLSPLGLLPEPYGEDGGGVPIKELTALYEEQAAALKKAGVDLLLAEAMPSLNEARAALLACRKTGLPVFLTLAADRQGTVLSGASLLACTITLQAMGAAAVGLHGAPPAALEGPLRHTLPHARVPLIARPAAGALSPLRFGEEMEAVLGAGAAVAGGCGALPEHAAVLRGVLDRFPTIAAPEISGRAAAGEEEAFFLSEDLEPCEPLPCDSSLADALIEAEDVCNAARVRVTEREDIPVLLEAARVCRLPLMLYADDPLVLDEALLRFPGRVLVDSLCEIETELVEEIAAHYGAIVF